MNEKTYRGIVIGCGKIGVLYEAVENRPHPRSHASALATNSRTELAAFVGRDERECAEALKYFPDTPCFTDLEEALRTVKPDIVIIAASTPAHAELAIASANAGVPIVIGEKPIATNLQEAQMLADALEKSGATFALNYQRRYFSLFRQARERLQAGVLGAITEVVCKYDNGLYNNGGHAIDTLLFLLGDEIVEVAGTVNADNMTYPEHDPNIDGRVTTKKGTTISFRSFDQKVTPIHELHLSGEHGTLSIANYGYSFVWNIDGVEERESEEVSMTSGVLDDAIHAYEEKRVPLSGVENGIAVLRALEALRQSAQSGGAVKAVVYS